MNATSGDDKVQIELPHRFQAAIDRAAMLADKKDSNSYIAEMGQDIRPLEGDDLRASVEAVVASIEAEFTMDRLNEYVRNGGFAPGSHSGPAGDGGSAEDGGSHLDSNSESAGDGAANPETQVSNTETP